MKDEKKQSEIDGYFQEQDMKEGDEQICCHVDNNSKMEKRKDLRGERSE